MFSTSVLCAIFSSVCKTSESELNYFQELLLFVILIIKNAYLYIFHLIICLLTVKYYYTHCRVIKL